MTRLILHAKNIQVSGRNEHIVPHPADLLIPMKTSSFSWTRLSPNPRNLWTIPKHSLSLCLLSLFKSVIEHPPLLVDDRMTFVLPTAHEGM